MSLSFVVSIGLLDPIFHGRLEGGRPEWPPSPLRAFQSLVAAAAARSRSEGLSAAVRGALRWLEAQPAPTIVAPVGKSGAGFTLSVPNNAMDIVARAWSRGNYSGKDANPATHRTMKLVRPTWLRDGDTIHYSWSLVPQEIEGVARHVEELGRIARSVVALGWGVDMAVGHAAILPEEEEQALAGERWQPTLGGGGSLFRTPTKGTLAALDDRYDHFVGRLEQNVFAPPPPLATYATCEYRRSSDPPPRPLAVFSLLKLDASAFRPFDTVRSGLTVAGMMRHATSVAAKTAGWSDEKINAFVLGHVHPSAKGKHTPVGERRFAYMPLPTIEARGAGSARIAGSIRRVLLTSFSSDCADELKWARRALSGQELVGDDGELAALLSVLPETDRCVGYYTRQSSCWSTVTPVVLPGHDDPVNYRRRLKHAKQGKEQVELLEYLDARVEALLRRSIVHAGYSQELADHAVLEWRKVGFWPGTDRANRYGVPDHLQRYPRLHVRLHWRDAKGNPVQVRGPVCLGAGRFYGVGLFAAETDTASASADARASSTAETRPPSQ